MERESSSSASSSFSSHSTANSSEKFRSNSSTSSFIIVDGTNDENLNNEKAEVMGSLTFTLDALTLTQHGEVRCHSSGEALEDLRDGNRQCQSESDDEDDNDDVENNDSDDSPRQQLEDALDQPHVPSIEFQPRPQWEIIELDHSILTGIEENNDDEEDDDDEAEDDLTCDSLSSPSGTNRPKEIDRKSTSSSLSVNDEAKRDFKKSLMPDKTSQEIDNETVPTCSSTCSGSVADEVRVAPRDDSHDTQEFIEAVRKASELELDPHGPWTLLKIMVKRLPHPSKAVDRPTPGERSIAS
jgi:hypothetical protein